VSSRDFFVYVLVSAGAAAEVVACVGVVAMRNAIDRLHYANAGTTLGPSLIAAAVCVREGIVSSQGLAALLIAVVFAFAGSALGIAMTRLVRVRTFGTIESTPAERERR
jgi:multisubunit Na+/H+ antiporter MnhG subunit